MSGDLMELNDTELNYINFGNETDSDNTNLFSVIFRSWSFSKKYSAMKDLSNDI